MIASSHKARCPRGVVRAHMLCRKNVGSPSRAVEQASSMTSTGLNSFSGSFSDASMAEFLCCGINHLINPLSPVQCPEVDIASARAG